MLTLVIFKTGKNQNLHEPSAVVLLFGVVFCIAPTECLLWFVQYYSSYFVQRTNVLMMRRGSEPNHDSV